MPDPPSVSRYPVSIAAGLTRADEFIEFACLTFHNDDSALRRRRAERLVAANPALAQESFLAAVVLGDVAAVRRGLEAHPGLAIHPGGPRGWLPLLYLCFGRVTGGRPDCDALEVARLLLAAGADPNSRALFYDCYHWTAMTGAIGEGECGPGAAPPHPQARALVELLLDAGADPNDSQALYNTHFRPGNEWLELFLSHGLGPEHTANWTTEDPKRMLDYLLGGAVDRGSLDRVALLLACGASPNGRLKDALLSGHTSVAALLTRHGAAPAVLSPAEDLRAAFLRADEAAVRRRLADAIEGRDDVGAFFDAAAGGKVRAVRLLLDVGVPIDSTNAGGLTALHLAAANGQRRVVDELLARGARMDIREPTYGATPLGSAIWHSRAWPSPERVDVCRALTARSTDVWNVTYAGDAQRLATLLAEQPSRANAKRPENGRSPLHVLAGSEVPGSEPLIDLLLQHGADLEARNNSGQTPLDLANEVYNDDVIAMLLRRGAQRGSG